MQKLLLACGFAAGLLFAYLDAQPHWNDSAILAFGLLSSSGIIALAGYRKPWLLALAVGIWIPLHDIFISHDIRIFLVTIFPLIGAYAGWVLNRALRKVTHPI